MAGAKVFVGLGAMEVEDRLLRDSGGTVGIADVALMDTEERWLVLVFFAGG